MASATSLSSTFSLALATAAEPFRPARALIRADSTRSPEMGKFSTARWVWACHLARAGTRTSPIESCSIRNSSLMARTVPSGRVVAPASAARLPFCPVVLRVRSPLTRLLAFGALVSLWAGIAVPAGADQIADKKAEAQRIASQLDAQSDRLADLAEQFNEARLQSEKVSAQAAAAQAEVARLEAAVQENRQAVR